MSVKVGVSYGSMSDMRLIRGYHDVPPDLRGAALAIGNFDGVHRGHQALLRRTLEIGRDMACPVGAMVFDPHPHVFFRPRDTHFALTPHPMKLARLAELGLDVAAVIPFDADLAALSAEDFIQRVLVEGWRIAHAVVGYDFSFGKGRSGTVATLREKGLTAGFGVTVVAPVAGENGAVFSSTAIRQKLAAGDVAGAAEVLGWRWRVRGMVQGGAKRGTGLGFPTANIPLPLGTALAHGIYAVWVHAGDATYGAAAYFGPRPTFDNGAPVLEVFLFDFDDDLYGREIEVEFVDFVRGDARFATPDALVAQMERDCRAAQAILGRRWLG